MKVIQSFRWLALALVVACSSNNLSGEISNESPNFQDAVFIQEEEAYGEDDEIIVALGPNNLCQRLAETRKGFNDYRESDREESDAEDYVEIWESNFDEQFWFAQIFIRVDDAEDELAGEELTGTDGVAPDDDNEAVIQFQEYTDYFDADDVVEGTINDAYRVYFSDDGDLEITRHTPGERLAGRFIEFDVTDDEGDDEGEDLRLTFSATRCDDWEDEVYED